MIENKYYTPTIEEFYVGFEFQYSCLNSEKLEKGIAESEWNQDLCEAEWLDTICFDWEANSDIFADGYRVKYLDSDDIRSLGFSGSDNTVKPPKGIDAKKFTKSIEDKEISIYYHCSIINHGLGIFIEIVDTTYLLVFKGYIKNKSELKKLLSQLQITK